MVADTAHVTEGVYIDSDAKVYGNAKVDGAVSVFNKSQIFGDAIVGGFTQLHHGARVFGDAHLYGGIIIQGPINVSVSFNGDLFVKTISADEFLQLQRELR